MAQTRERVCIYYEWEGQCAKGREGTFRHACQKCHKYQAKKGSQIARPNLKKTKMEKIKTKDAKEMMRES